jgi:hypothetical protein
MAVPKYIKQADFVAETKSRFEFLRERDFLGPEAGDYWLSYSSGVLGIEIHYDDSDGRVLTIIRSSIGDRNPRAGLQCLYVSATLGPAQDIREIARSSKALGPVLESHAAALKRVLPVLEGPGGADLLLKCHGR